MKFNEFADHTLDEVAGTQASLWNRIKQGVKGYLGGDARAKGELALANKTKNLHNAVKQWMGQTGYNQVTPNDLLNTIQIPQGRFDARIMQQAATKGNVPNMKMPMTDRMLHDVLRSYLQISAIYHQNPANQQQPAASGEAPAAGGEAPAAAPAAAAAGQRPRSITDYSPEIQAALKVYNHNGKLTAYGKTLSGEQRAEIIKKLPLAGGPNAIPIGNFDGDTGEDSDYFKDKEQYDLDPTISQMAALNRAKMAAAPAAGGEEERLKRMRADREAEIQQSISQRANQIQPTTDSEPDYGDTRLSMQQRLAAAGERMRAAGVPPLPGQMGTPAAAPAAAPAAPAAAPAAPAAQPRRRGPGARYGRPPVTEDKSIEAVLLREFVEKLNNI